MMKKVDYYYKTELPSEDPDVHVNLLTDIFETSTVYGGVNLFEDIYIPVKLVTSSGLADDWSYMNIGLDADEIADIYYAQYSGNFLLDIDLKKRVKAIFKKNVGKYLKLLEVQGYSYNPLWNVDGTEIRQQLENRGTNDTEYGGVTSNFGDNFSSVRTDHDVSGFNTSGYRDGSKDETYGTENNTIGVGHQEVRMDAQGQMQVTGVDAPNNASSSYRGSVGSKTSTQVIHKNAKNIVSGEEVEYAVSASDTAFGTALIGGDRMYLEKYIRQGNIGVTKSTELIEAQRDIVRYVLLQEFFDDINEVVLIGLYGNY